MVAKAKTKARPKTGSKRAKERGAELVWKLAPPHLLGPGIVGAGHAAHLLWGQSPASAAWAGIGMAAGGAGLTAVSYLHSRARSTLLRAHTTVTVAAGSVGATVTMIQGAHRPWLDWALGVGVLVGLSWNIRQADVVRGTGEDDHDAAPTGGVLAELGIPLKRPAKVIEASRERAEVVVDLDDGKTADDVQKVTATIGSKAGTLRGGVQAIPDPEREGRVTVTLQFTDLLKKTQWWPGPMLPGGSIADGLWPGNYADGAQVRWWPAGSYSAENPVAPGHLVIMGLSRVGKTLIAQVGVTDLATRRDVWIMWGDKQKGSQTARPLRKAIGWYESKPNRIKAQLTALMRAVSERNDVLGRHGYKAWTPEAFLDPRLRMPALWYQLEEAAPILIDNPNLMVELSEAALSAGVFLCLSLQRASNDRMPTSLRYNVANAMCLGVGDDVSAPFVLSPATLKASPDPYEWGARFPGRVLAEFNGIDPTRFPVPWKSFYDTDEQFEAVVEEHLHLRPELDPVTRRAFGPVYEQYLANPPTWDADGAAGAVGDATDDEQPSATVVPIRSAPTATDSAGTDEPGDDEADEDEYVIPPNPEPEIAARINPRAELPAYNGPDIDMTPESRPGDRTLTVEERRQAFAGLLADWVTAGRSQFKMAELVEAWNDRVGPVQASQRPWLTERLNDLIDNGALDRHQEGRGVYLITEPNALLPAGAHA